MIELLRKYMPDSIKYIIFLIFTKPLGILYGIISLLPICNNKIVVRCYEGKGVGDNPKYIIEELLKKNNNIEIVWLVKDKKEFNNNKYRFENIKSIRAFYEMATAKIWISNTRIPIYFKKKIQQYYVQTWHGGLGLKRVEGAAISSLSKSYICTAKNDSKKADLFVSNSKYRTRLYRDYFWYDKEIIEKGLPRNDNLVNGTLIKKRKNILSKDKSLDNKVIVLYAPTFRRSHSIECYDIDFNKVKEVLEKKYNKECIILIRFHHIVAQLSDKICKKYSFVRNVSFVPDILDLLAVTDVLISDYSSVMFDYMLLKKPIFIYASDLEEYTKERDFMFPIKETPFPFAENNTKLIKNINSIDSINFEKKYKNFADKFGLIETGYSSELVADKILENLAK